MELYYIDSNYCRYLRSYDALVPYIYGDKKRPFIGVVIYIQMIAFFAPLTSPKRKHRKMSNQMDFFKIDDGRLGALNLNNMIPVQEGLYQRVHYEADEYTALLQRQLHWCRLHQKEIQEHALWLFDAVTSGQAPAKVMERCCNFYQDLLRLQLYCDQNELLTHGLVMDSEEELFKLNYLFYRCSPVMIYG